MSECSLTQHLFKIRISYSTIWMLLNWCHLKLLSSWRTFCVHHTAMHQFTVSFYLKTHTWGVCVFSFATCTFNRTTSNCWLIVNFIRSPSKKEKWFLKVFCLPRCLWPLVWQCLWQNPLQPYCCHSNTFSVCWIWVWGTCDCLSELIPPSALSFSFKLVRVTSWCSWAQGLYNKAIWPASLHIYRPF